MSDEDENFRGSLVLDFTKWWRHVKTIYTLCILFFGRHVRLLSLLVLKLLYNQQLLDPVFYSFYLRGTSQLRGQLSLIQVQLDVVHSSIAAQAGHSSCLS